MSSSKVYSLDDCNATADDNEDDDDERWWWSTNEELSIRSRRLILNQPLANATEFPSNSDFFSVWFGLFDMDKFKNSNEFCARRYRTQWLRATICTMFTTLSHETNYCIVDGKQTDGPPPVTAAANSSGGGSSSNNNDNSGNDAPNSKQKSKNSKIVHV